MEVDEAIGSPEVDEVEFGDAPTRPSARPRCGLRLLPSARVMLSQAGRHQLRASEEGAGKTLVTSTHEGRPKRS